MGLLDNDNETEEKTEVKRKTKTDEAGNVVEDTQEFTHKAD